MKKNNLLNKSILLIGLMITIFLTSCSNEIEAHKKRIAEVADSHKTVINNRQKPIVKHETEIFDRKVSVTFFNEALKDVLPTLVTDVKYVDGVNKVIPVSLEVIKMPINKALHKILKPIGLSYIRTTGGILVIKQKRITFRAFNQPLDIVMNAMLGDISYVVRDGAEKSLKKLVSVEFKDLPIEMALDRLLSQLNIDWKKESDSYIIFRDKEQLFTVNFPLLQQTFSVNSSREKLKDKDEDNDNSISFTSSQLLTSGNSASLNNLTKTIEQFLTDEGRVVIHKEIGMIWVKDRADVVDRVGDFLASINDSLSRSVAISGIITEVELDKSKKVGIDWSSVAGSLTRAGGTIANSGLTVGDNGANFTIGWKSGSGTLNNAYINALDNFGDVKVVSRPSLRVANNAIGSLVVGRNTSYVAEVESTASSNDTTRYASKLETLQTGLNFYVLPHIISNTEAIVYISPELTSIEEIRLISSGVDTPQIEAPTITMRQTQTIVPIRNGESIVIGGLMAETNKSNKGETLFFSGIPLLGDLFKTEDSTSGVSEFSMMIKVSW